mgnify:CR=1 FL=1
MEKILFVVVIILCVILILLLGIVAYSLLRYVKIQEKTSLSPEMEAQSELIKKMPEEIRKEVKAAEELTKTLVGQFCVDHPENPSKGVCSISNEHYCELCITKEKDVRIGRKFLNLFLDTKWQDSFFFSNDKIGSEKLDELIRVKKELWSNKAIPVIAQKQFKINIETNETEVYTVVMTREEDKGIIDTRLGFLNK